MHKVSSSAHFLFVAITYPHLIILTHLPAISLPLITYSLSILRLINHSCGRGPTGFSDEKNEISIYGSLLICFSLFHNNHPLTCPALFPGIDQSTFLIRYLSHFTLKVNFNHAQALSRAAAAVIPLGDGVTAYRITPLFIKEPVTHYSLRSSRSH